MNRILKRTLVILAGVMLIFFIFYFFNINRILFTAPECRGEPIIEFHFLDASHDKWTTCNFNSAISNQNSKVCKYLDWDRVTDLSISDKCYFNIATNTKNPEMCEKIKTPIERHDCLHYIALATLDDSVCKKMAFENQISTCDAYVFAKKYGDSSKCQSLGTNVGCFVTAVVSSGNLKICDELLNLNNDSELVDSCKHDVAWEMGREDICGTIEDNSLRDSCYSIVANVKNDSRICDKMEDSKKREFCLIGK